MSIGADFVSMEDGTGIVHVAPAYGEVDYQAGQENGLDFVQMVDLQGKITGNYPFAGKFVKNADPLILEDLKSRDLLIPQREQSSIPIPSAGAVIRRCFITPSKPGISRPQP